MSEPLTWQTPDAVHRQRVRQALGLGLPVGRGLAAGAALMCLVLGLGPALRPEFTLPAGKLLAMVGLFGAALLLPLAVLPLIARPGRWRLDGEGLTRLPGGRHGTFPFSGLARAWTGPLDEKLEAQGLWISMQDGRTTWLPLPEEKELRESVLDRFRERLGNLAPPDEPVRQELPRKTGLLLCMLTLAAGSAWGWFLGSRGPLGPWLALASIAPLLAGPGTWVMLFSLGGKPTGPAQRGTLWGFNACTAAIAFLVMILVLARRLG